MKLRSEERPSAKNLLKSDQRGRGSGTFLYPAQSALTIAVTNSHQFLVTRFVGPDDHQYNTYVHHPNEHRSKYNRPRRTHAPDCSGHGDSTLDNPVPGRFSTVQCLWGTTLLPTVPEWLAGPRKNRPSKSPSCTRPVSGYRCREHSEDSGGGYERSRVLAHGAEPSDYQHGVAVPTQAQDR